MGSGDITIYADQSCRRMLQTFSPHDLPGVSDNSPLIIYGSECWLTFSPGWEWTLRYSDIPNPYEHLLHTSNLKEHLLQPSDSSELAVQEFKLDPTTVARIRLHPSHIGSHKEVEFFDCDPRNNRGIAPIRHAPCPSLPQTDMVNSLVS